MYYKKIILFLMLFFSIFAIKALALNSNQNNNNQIQNNNNWYNPSTKYYKISTKRDGIALIKLSDILSIDNSLTAKQSRFLHLIYKGDEVPFFIKNDDGAIDNSDEIYFIGSRAKGDTTWFDSYDTLGHFFLYYSEDSKGLRYANFPNVDNILDTLKTIPTLNHLEKDSIFTFGHFDNYQISSDKVVSEEWAWDTLHSNGHDFNINAFFPSEQNDNDSITIRVLCQGIEWGNDDNKNPLNTPYQHKFDLIFNCDTISVLNLKLIESGILTAKVPSSKILCGMNKIAVRSMPIYYSATEFDSYEISYVDYVELEGNKLPFFDHGYGDFIINSLTNNSQIDLYGIKNNSAIIIDTVNNYYSLPDLKSGSSVSIGVKSGSYPMTSITINDSTFQAKTTNGLHIAVLKAPDYSSYENKEFDQTNSDAINYINSLTDGSVITIGCNSNNPCSQDIVNYFKSIGSKLISSVTIGTNWAVAFRKNISNSLQETINNSGNANLSTFIEFDNGKSYDARLFLEKDKQYKVFISCKDSIEQAIVEATEASDLRNTSNQADLLIITHGLFKEVADSLKAYRERHDGVKAMVINVDDIYKEFGYGLKSPHPIKDFIKYTTDSWQNPIPQYVTLIGDACWDSRKIFNYTKRKDYVPTFGWPATDYWYVLFDYINVIPMMAIGRIPISTVEQGLDYIDKVKDYESQKASPWMKNFLFLSGGQDAKQLKEFADLVYFYNLITNPFLCSYISSIAKESLDPVDATKGVEIREKINNGVEWINYIGHGSPERFDIDGWNADLLNNKDKYFILSTVACNIGAFAQPDINCRTEEYVIAKDKGAIVAIASTSGGIVEIDRAVVVNIFRTIADTTLKMRRIGDILKHVKTGMKSDEDSIDYITTVEQFDLLGDPMVELNIASAPDLYLIDNEITIKSNSGTEFYTENDSSVIISGTIYNNGYGFGCTNQDTFNLVLTREYENKTDTIKITFRYGICTQLNFSFTLPIINMPGLHKITITIDPDKHVNDPDRSNNQIYREIQIFNKGLLALEPSNYWNVNAKMPDFRVINPLDSADSYIYTFSIYNSNDTTKTPIFQSIANDIVINEAFIEWKPNIVLENNKPYWLIVSMKSKINSNQRPNLLVPFHTDTISIRDSVRWNISNNPQLGVVSLNSMSINTDTNSVSKITNSKTLLPYYVYGAYGISSENGQGYPETKSYSEFIVGSNIHFYLNDLLGINVLTVSKTDTSKYSYRFFNTWSGGWLDDSSAMAFTYFLRDTVTENEYVFISCESFFYRQFLPPLSVDAMASLDTLKSVLKLYGSGMADSLIKEIPIVVHKRDSLVWWGLSYVMIGEKGAKEGSAIEDIKIPGESITFSGELPYYMLSGDLTTPKIGPSKSWTEFDFDGFFPDSISNKYINIYGIDKSSGNEVPLLYDSTKSIDLSSISADIYPYIKAKINLTRSSFLEEPYINKLSCKFVPTPEFAVLNKETYIEQDTIMRADTNIFHLALQNISPRMNSDTNSVVENIINGQNVLASNTFSIPPLKSDDSTNIPYIIDTKELSLVNLLTVNTNYKNTPCEIYTFNNSYKMNFYLYDDTIKPSVIIYADGKEIHDGDYISQNSTFVVDLYDNSYLPINDTRKIVAKLNFFTRDSSNTKYYYFEPISGKFPLHASLTFTPDTLFNEDNDLTIIAQDATGNLDTVEYTLWVSQNGFIDNVTINPNPVSYNLDISFLYKAPTNEGNIKIDVYNINGKAIKNFELPALVGENVIHWDGLDNQGMSMPIGVYVFRISAQSSIYSEPYYGKFIVVR